jgi:hypothetical protein
VADTALERMQARARLVRTRSAIRHWEYRQRHLAAGVWFRLRRVLADASAAYAIAEEDAYRLRAEGYVSEACGAEIEPPKLLLFVDARRLDAIGSRRHIPVGLGPDFLAAPAVALVPFDGIRDLSGQGNTHPPSSAGTISI